MHEHFVLKCDTIKYEHKPQDMGGPQPYQGVGPFKALTEEQPPKADQEPERG
jgi:hypothetical protein